MKKLLILFAVFSFITIHAEAQRAGRSPDKISPEKIAERMTERMSEALSLSETQKKEIYALHLERATKRMEEVKAKREKTTTEHQADEEKIEAILTPEQKILWEKRKSEHQEKAMPQRGRKRSPDGQKGNS